jgi:hypothetical protein
LRPIRCLATALLVASLAMAGCGRSQPDEGTAPGNQPPAATVSKAPAPDDPTDSPPMVLADGRHAVFLTTVDPTRRTITFDLIQLYTGDDATREAAKDHQESPPPNDYYIRNINPKLRTLPTAADATISVNTLAWERTHSATKNVPVTLEELAAMMPGHSGQLFSITAHHDQVVKMAELYRP